MPMASARSFRAAALLVAFPVGALLYTGACDSAPVDAPPPSASAMAGATVAATAKPVVTTVTPVTPPTGGRTITLSGGATLTAPPGASPYRAPKKLPDEVVGVHHFKLDNPKRLLLFTEMKLDSGCKERLDQEWAKLKKSKDDTDPKRLALRKVDRIEEHKVNGHRFLFGTGKQTDPKGGDGSSAPIVTGMMCEGKNHVVFMHASREPVPVAQIREMMKGVVASYRPAKGK